MFELSISEEKTNLRWQEYVQLRPEAHFYFDYRWKTVLEDSFNHKPLYFFAQQNGKIIGVFPIFFINSRIIKPCLVSMPFLNYGGILADNKDVESFLFQGAVNMANKLRANYIEIRDFKRYEMKLTAREHKVTMILETGDSAEKTWANLDPKVRNEIRKAEKSGLKIEIGKSDMLDYFYEIFCHNMRDLGTPVLSRHFFENMLKTFDKEVSIFLVRLGNKVIAASLTICHMNVMEAPWASSIRAFNKLCPNELLYWEMIKYAIDRGCKKFDFGRCTKDSGTYRFKKQWNPKIVQLYWQYWSHSDFDLPPANPQKSRFKPLIEVWKRLPIFIANTIGPSIARGIPTF